MPPLFTINLIRALFVAFTTVIGVTVADGSLVGGAAGAAFGLSIVLADRLLKGVSLRLFSSATFGLLMGLIFSRLLLASDVLKHVHPDTRWVVGLATYAACA